MKISRTLIGAAGLILGLAFSLSILPWTTTRAESPRKLPSAPASVTPLAYWKFDEGSGSTALDSTGNNYTGTLGSGVTYTSTTAPISTTNPFAAQFDGVNGMVTASSLATVPLTQAVTFDVWVYFNQLPSTAGHIMYIMGKSGSGNNLDLQVLTDNHIYFYVASGDIASRFPVQTHTWYHIIVTYQANAQTAMYVNGWFQSSAAIDAVGDSGNPFTLGESTVFTGRHLNGIVDDAQIYDSVQVPAPPSPFVAYLKFDEGSGITALDSTGNNNIGTLGSGVTYTTTTAPISTTNPFGAKFDGINGIVTLSGTGSISFTQAATFDVWVYLNKLPSTAGHIMHIIGKSDNTSDLDLQVETDNHIKFYVDGGVHIDSTTVVLTNTWYHIIVNYQANTQMTMYVNCALQSSLSIDFARGDAGHPITLGENMAWPGRHLNGIIDDIRIYASVEPSAGTRFCSTYLPLVIKNS